MTVKWRDVSVVDGDQSRIVRLKNPNNTIRSSFSTMAEDCVICGEPGATHVLEHNWRFGYSRTQGHIDCLVRFDNDPESIADQIDRQMRQKEIGTRPT